MKNPLKLNILTLLLFVFISITALSFSSSPKLDEPSNIFDHYNQVSCHCTVGAMIGMGGIQYKCFALFGDLCFDDMPCEVYCYGQYVPCALCYPPE